MCLDVDGDLKIDASGLILLLLETLGFCVDGAPGRGAGIDRRKKTGVATRPVSLSCAAVPASRPQLFRAERSRTNDSQMKNPFGLQRPLPTHERLRGDDR